MKRVYTFLVLCFSIIIYCFSINNDAKGVAHNFKNQDVGFIKKDLTRPSLTLNYNGVISQPENLTEFTVSSSNYDTNTSLQKFSFFQNTEEQFFINKLKQYSRASLSCLLQYRKTDVIFPFHYFW